MNFTVILLLASGLQVSARSYSQSVTLHLENAPLNKVFQEIKRQTGYTFMYTGSMLKEAKKVTIQVKNSPLQEALNLCFNDQPFGYTIIDKTVVLQPKEKVTENDNSSITALPPPPVEIHGRVVNGKGEPIPNVSVVVAGTKIGTTTDNNGGFTLTVSNNKNIILQISSVGYLAKTIKVGNQTEINITLEQENSKLNEVVVVGYGEQQKKDITGSVAVVDVNSLKAQPSASVTEALQGKAAGVNIINDGSPGSTPQIRIRGYSTVNNNDPLYIIDGVPYQGNIAWLNQNDVQSIQVLKDASSASIYGSRANNGVVIITTKKGKEGATKITLDTYYGSSTPVRSTFPHFLTPKQYADRLFQSYKNVNLDPVPSLGGMYGNGPEAELPTYLIAGNASGFNVTDEAADPSKYNHDPAKFYQITKANQQGTDWMRAITRNAPVQSYQLNASGGGKNSLYSLSLGYLNQQGIIDYTSFKRYSIRSNTQFKMFDNHLTIGTNILFSRTEGIGFATNVSTPGAYQTTYGAIGDVYMMQPIIPVYDIGGNFAGARGPTLGAAKNPLAFLYRAKDNYRHENRLFGNVFADVNILKNLTARTSFGANLSNYNSQNIRYPSMEDAVSIATNGYDATEGLGSQWTWSNTINYKNSFKGQHDLSVLIGSEANYGSNRDLTGSRDNFFLLGDLNYYYLNAGSANIQNAESGSLDRLFSLFGRVDYSFKDKYLLSATVRRDGSSKFGELNRYGVFPSFGAAWRISQEQFLKDVSWINDLKLRVGYGETGNQNIPSNNAVDLYSPLITTSSYPITGTNTLAAGVSQSQIGNSALKWEKLRATNIGLDVTLFKNVLDGSLDIYKRTTSDMLFPVPLPSQTAGMASSPFRNVGSMQNEGIEVVLNYHYLPSKNGPFSFDIGLNLAKNQNKILELAPGITNTLYGTGELTTTVLEVGKPFGEFYGYKQAGIFQNAQEVASSTQPGARIGGMKYADVNGDGIFSSDDRTTLGSPLPDFTYGLNVNVTYQKFDLVCFFYGSHGNKLYNETKLFTDFQYFPSPASTRLLDAWSPTNTHSMVPSASVLSSPLEYQSSSYYIENGSYFRLKNLQIGYTLRDAVRGISKLRIYGSVTNLFTITKYSGLDPEVSQYNTSISLPGVDLGVYPNSRQFLIGLNASF